MKLHKATDRVVRILELLSKKTNGLTLNEIVESIDEPKTSVYEILNTLKHKNMIEYNENKKFSIGVRTFQIGTSYIRKNSLIAVARRPIEELADKLRKTVILGVLDNMRVTHIHKHEPYGQIIVTTSIGTRAEIHSTASGKVLLAYEKDKKVQSILNMISFDYHTNHTITNKADFIENLSKVAQKGYAIADRENNENIITAAAPIFDYQQNIVSALSIIGVYNENENLEELAKAVKETADSITNILNHLYQDE